MRVNKRDMVAVITAAAFRKRKVTYPGPTWSPAMTDFFNVLVKAKISSLEAAYETSTILIASKYKGVSK